MSAVLLFATVTVALGLYSLLLLAVFSGRAFENGRVQGRREIVDRAALRAGLRAPEGTPIHDAVVLSMDAHPARTGTGMTATAQGRALPCDYARCDRPATTGNDAWVFCDQHAGQASAEDAGASLVLTAKGAHLAPAPALVDRIQTVQERRADAMRAHPASQQPRPAPAPAPGPSPLGLLLEQASGHTVSKVRRLAARIEQQLDDLRELVREHDADEKRRQAEAAEQEKARAEVARLEAALAEARAKLKGKPAPATAVAHSLTGRKQAPRPPLACPDCDATVLGNQGLALHRKARHGGTT